MTEQSSSPAAAVAWRNVRFALFAVVFGALFLANGGRAFLPGVSHGGGPQYQACPYRPEFPLTVHIQEQVPAAPWREAVAVWDDRYPGTFELTTGAADVEIVPSAQTWVTLPCDGARAIVHAGHDVDLQIWATHEMGHTLAYRDSVPDGTDTRGYINPGRCPSADYDGLMSYCHSPHTEFTPDDDAAMASIGWRAPSPLAVSR